MSKTVQLSHAEIKEKLIEMLDFLNQFFCNHNLKYSIMSGTMLGAVRHGGFIPWDDDIDIGMERSEYNRLIDIIRDEDNSESKYDFVGYELGNAYWPFIKMIHKHVIVREENSKTDEHLWIDIFPFDYLPKALGKVYLVLLSKTVKKLMDFKVSDDLCIECKEKTSNVFIRGYLRILKYLSRKVSFNVINSILIRLSTCFSPSSGLIMDLTWGTKSIPKSFFDEIADYRFESLKVKGFRNYDGYLKCIYGDYMKLPPEEKRINHSIIAWSISEDEE